jgi:putative transposase
LKRRSHTDVARCTVARLMKDVGLSGVVRGRKVRTTEADPSATRAPDLLRRDFVATAPNRVWVADFTHVAAWAGTVYVAFVVDTFSRRVVGWSAATNKRTDLVLSAFEMGLWQRERTQHPVRQRELIHHSDAGSQRVSGHALTWTQRPRRNPLRPGQPSARRPGTPGEVNAPVAQPRVRSEPRRSPRR